MLRNKISWLLMAVATGGSTIAFGVPVRAGAEPADWEKINFYSQQAHPMEQVTEVQQLRDVSPEDWAYQALESLVERYGCIAGYPDGTFRGDRPLTRWELAAALNACLNSFERLLGENVAVPAEDLDKLRRLAREMEGELAVLGISVNQLESRTAFLEDHQFSVTTKLKGEVAFTLGGASGDEKAGGGSLNTQLTLDDRLQLYFDTSFTGKDLLRVRLDAINAQPLGVQFTGTNMTRLAFDGDTDNQLIIGQLFYRFPLGRQLRITVDGTGGRLFSNVPNYNTFFAPALTGSLSRFGRFNPIYYQGILGAGASANYKFSDTFNFSLGYLARNPQDPQEGNGLFNGSYAALAQLGITPAKNLELGLTYVRAYYPSGQSFVSGGTGSRAANTPFGQLPTSADQFGLETSWRINPQISLSGWAGWTQAQAEASGRGFGGATTARGDAADIFNWAIALLFPDLGSQGSVGGLLVGNPPKVTANDGGPSDPATAWHIQAQYRYQITQNIAINPGFFVIINPENDSQNEAIWVEAIRMIFQF